jgi:hypothetical protein
MMNPSVPQKPVPQSTPTGQAVERNTLKYKGILTAYLTVILRG